MLIVKRRDGSQSFNLVADEVRKYYYHLTTESWDTSVTLRPMGDGWNRAPFEPGISRTCVGPSFCHCASAIEIYGGYTWKLYRTSRKVVGFFPHGVEDANLTEEHWLLFPTKFVKVWDVPEDVIDELNGMCSGVEFGSPHKDELNTQKVYIDKLKRYVATLDLPPAARL